MFHCGFTLVSFFQPQVVRGQHWLHFGLKDEAAKNWRPLMDRIYMPPVPFFTQGRIASTGDGVGFSLLESGCRARKPDDFGLDVFWGPPLKTRLVVWVFP